jgi:sugar phosphate isomerase/epimerase
MGEPTKYEPKATRELLKKHKIACSGAVTIMLSDRDLTHANPKQWEVSVQYVIDCVKMIEALGGEVLCLVPGEVGRVVPHGPPEECWKRAVEGIKRVADVGRKCKVTIGLEPLNRFETGFLNRGEQALELARQVGDDVGVTLDTFHLNIEEVNMTATIKQAGKKLVDFHVADNNRRPPGQGSINWKAVIATLKEMNYTGTITSEFVNPLDRTPVARTPTTWGGKMPSIEGAPPELLKFIVDHGSGILTQEDYDLAVKQTIEFLKSLV